MQITPVEKQADLKTFVEFPYRHYRDDPVWVPPLRSEQFGQYNPVRNPMLNHCEYALFLLKDGRQVIGRISAFTDSLALEAWQEPIGLFGAFECVDDPAAARLLLDTARGWLRKKGMRAMRGPWSFASQEWGLVVEGYTPPPVIMAPYNPPYYNDLLAGYGLQKVKDLLVYYADAREGYTIPERIMVLTDKIRERYGVRTRPVDMKHYERDVAHIVEMANTSIAGNWGYYPATMEEGRALARDLKQIINPRAAILAEDSQGRIIGFALSLPDINILLRGLNGRLFPVGFLRLLFGLPRLHQYRMWALGVIPAYHGKAIDSLLYRATIEALYTEDVRVEINYVLEDNYPMNNALAKLNVKPLRRYRVYQMEIG